MSHTVVLSVSWDAEGIAIQGALQARLFVRGVIRGNGERK